MRARTAAVLVPLVACAFACAGAKHAVAPAPPLGTEGEVHVYVQPLEHEAERLAFDVTAVSLVGPGGLEAPLRLVSAMFAGTKRRDQQLVATGRVPAGDYTGLTVKVGSATLGAGDDRSSLLVRPEPARVEVDFRLGEGTSAVLWLTLKAGASLRADYGFAPVFTGAVAPQTPPQVALYVTNTGAASVTAIDRGEWLVTGVVPVGAAPRGIALDRSGRHAYVALSRDDQVEILDVAANRAVGRIRLMPGDGPGELARAPDGTLLVLNERSRTLSFVDPEAQAEVARVPVGEAPVALRLDRSGARAYVANRGSASITVVDVANRAVAMTVATDPEPIQLDLSRDGARLYVIHRGSAYLEAFPLPALGAPERTFVGLGATAIKVDVRSDLLYLSHGTERRVAVYEPIALQRLEELEVPGAVSRMAIDDTGNALLLLMPGRGAIGVLDLTSRVLRSEISVDAAPFAMALLGER